MAMRSFCFMCSIRRRSGPRSRIQRCVLDMETGDDDRSDAGLCATRVCRRRSMRTSPALRERAQRSGIDCVLIDTSKPLDDALRSYLLLRQGRA